MPARVISTFDEYVSKRRTETSYPAELKPGNETISEAFAEWCWKEFCKAHEVKIE